MKIHSLDRLREVSSLSVNNTLKDPEAQQKMTQYGFSPRRMKEGKTLLQQLEQQCRTQEQHYEAHWELAHRMDNELRSTRAVFVAHVEVARFAFRNEPAILRKLAIRRLATNRWAWVKQAQSFYTKVTEHTAAMETHGVKSEELAQAQASLQAIAALREDLTRRKGDAEDATQRKQQADKELRAWLSEFRTVARMAFKETPQKLEAFGIRVR